MVAALEVLDEVLPQVLADLGVLAADGVVRDDDLALLRVPADGLRAAVAATLQAVTKLKGEVRLVAPGSLPNDGKVIADERPVS